MLRRRAWLLGVLGTSGILTNGLSRRAGAAGWANALFQENSHDFGPVPRGSKVRHAFVLSNRLAEPITLASVRASCGCTTGWATATVVPPGQSAAVEAEMDTRNFVGRKETVLYVTVVTASGREGEARLGVGSTILSDIVLNPGAVDFGVVSRGQTPSLEVTIDRIGMPDWRVHRLISSCRAIDAALQETRRAGDAVSYRLTVSLRGDARAGVIRDEIRLLGNDPQTPMVPVAIAAVIRGDLTASPGSLALGSARSAGLISGKVLVRSSRPFTISSVAGEGDGFHVTPDNTEPRPIHILTVSFHPEESPSRGDLRREFLIQSDLPGEPPVPVVATLRHDP